MHLSVHLHRRLQPARRNDRTSHAAFPVSLHASQQGPGQGGPMGIGEGYLSREQSPGTLQGGSSLSHRWRSGRMLRARPRYLQVSLAKLKVRPRATPGGASCSTRHTGRLAGSAGLCSSWHASGHLTPAPLASGRQREGRRTRDLCANSGLSNSPVIFCPLYEINKLLSPQDSVGGGGSPLSWLQKKSRRQFVGGRGGLRVSGTVAPRTVWPLSFASPRLAPPLRDRVLRTP